MIDAVKSFRQLIGNYRIIKEISSSPLTSVYQAEHPLFAHQRVAIKVFATLSLSPHESEQFLSEAKLLKKLKHPHVLPLLDTGISDGIPYIVTEYIEKGSLRDALEEQSSQLLSTHEIISLLSQIGKALQYAHQLNITHGNLKPENILLDKDGHALLADFHILTLFDLVRPDSAYNVNMLPYLAPEQFSGRMRKESDQYALGSIAYELFTRTPPFFALNFATMRFKQATETVTPPTLLNMLLPIHFEKVILKAMSKQEVDRYPHIKDFIADLDTSPPAQKLLFPSQQTPVPPSSASSPEIRNKEHDELAVPAPVQPVNTTSKLAHKHVSLVPLPLQEPATSPESVDNTTSISSAQTTPQIELTVTERVEEDTPVPEIHTSLYENALTRPVVPVVDALPPDLSGLQPQHYPQEAQHLFVPFKGSSIKNISRASNGKIAKPFWWIVLASWAIVLVIVLGMFMIILPILSTQSLPKPAVKQVLSPAPTSIVSAQPTLGKTPQPSPTTKPTAIPTLQPSPSPIVIPSPSPTVNPTPVPSPPVQVMPTRFNGTTDCKFVQTIYFQCAVTLELSATYQNSVHWTAHSNGISALFMPQKGMLSPGKPQQITFYVFSSCPISGSITFATKVGNVTVPWSC